jgi:hypothetical protein
MKSGAPDDRTLARRTSSTGPGRIPLSRCLSGGSPEAVQHRGRFRRLEAGSCAPPRTRESAPTSRPQSQVDALKSANLPWVRSVYLRWLAGGIRSRSWIPAHSSRGRSWFALSHVAMPPRQPQRSGTAASRHTCAAEAGSASIRRVAQHRPDHRTLPPGAWFACGHTLPD